MENKVLLDIHKITNKIMFIYKALEDGWTVVKIDTDKYEFSKKFDNTWNWSKLSFKINISFISRL